MPTAARISEVALALLRSLAFDQRMAAGLFALMALLPILSPVLGGSYLLLIGERVMIFAIAAISVELLIGVGGLVSFGHAAFLGIGAYGAGIAASHGLGTLSVALPAALAASALFALATGAIAVRTRGVYFIMITLAFGQMAFFVATSLAPYGGDDGLTWPTRTLVLGTRLLKSETAFFYVILVLLVAVYLLVSRLIASRFGRVLRGLTDNETRMQAIGFTPYPYRLTAYVIAGTICGLAGFLLGNQAEFVSPAYMHWQRSGELIMMVLLGGTGTLYGPIVGAAAFLLLEETLSRLTEHWKAILGPLLVLVVLFAKGGIAGGIDAWRRRKMTPAQLLAVLMLVAKQGFASVSNRGRRWKLLLDRRIDALVALFRRAVAEAAARWRLLQDGTRPLAGDRTAVGRARPCRCHRSLEAAMSTAVLRLEHLQKSFGALKVTDGISLDILAGETHAVIGPNGAGKTTLIHQISGALAPDAGRIIFDGRDVTHLPMPARAHLGLARSFQITHVLPHFTALENVALAVQARSGSSFHFWQPAALEEALNAPAMEALKVVELTTRAQTPAGSLPHGEKRRLEIAIALAQAPKLLLLDEPMAGAGAQETPRLIETLEGLKRRITIVLVEHDMQAVFALADRVSVLVEGRIIATDTPHAVRANPAVRAAYLGEAA